MEDIYCGPAPVTWGEVSQSWNLDWIAFGFCAAIIIAHMARREPSRLALVFAIVTLSALFLSPFCALTAALFSARAVHHVLLIAVAAPFLALAFPPRGVPAGGISLPWLAGIHALILWLWHVPDIYALAVQQAGMYWLMQISLLGSAWLMWRGILDSRKAAGPALAALLATIVQMGMLGALLTFAREPLYEPHFFTTTVLGLTPLEDQQLAGLAMWVPAALPYLCAALLRLRILLNSCGPRTRSAEGL